MKRKLFWGALGLLGLFLFITAAGAQDYPNKPITLQVPYPPGWLRGAVVAAVAAGQFATINVRLGPPD